MIIKNDKEFLALKEEDLLKVKEIISVSIFEEHKNKRQHLLTKIARCKNIESLTLHTNGIDEWPSAFFELRKLTYLYVYDLHEDATFFQHIGKLQSLKTLRLYWCSPPDYNWDCLTTLQNLEHLYLQQCTIIDLSPAFAKLTQLKVLDLRKNTSLKKLPAFVLKLPHLQELYVDAKLIRKLKGEEQEALSKLAYFYRNSPTEKKYVQSFQGAFPKYNLTDAHRLLALNLLADDEASVQRLHTRDLLIDLTIIPRFDIIRIRAIDYLGKWYSEGATESLADPTTELMIAGKIHTNKNDLRKRLKEVGLVYKTALGANTTHVVIGQSSKIDLNLLKDKRLKLLTEDMLNEYLDQVAPQYLVADEGMSQQLKQLLLAQDENSIELALQLMKEGGIPKNIINELFVAWGGQGTGNLKNRLAKIIRQISSTALGDYVKKDTMLYYPNSRYGRSESSLYTNLRKLEAYKELDTIRIGRILYDLTQKGIKYLLAKMTAEQKVEFLKSLCEGTSLNLSYKELTSLPKELTALTFLTKLNVKGNRLRSYSKHLAKLVNLEELDISNNNINVGKQLPHILPNCKIIS